MQGRSWVARLKGVAARQVSATVVLMFALVANSAASPQAAPSDAGAFMRLVGTAKTITPNSITVASDSGTEARVVLDSTTRLLCVAPGQKDLTGATPIQLQDIQAGDRILVRARPSDDAKSLIATSIVVMKQSDIAERREREREDWQRRGAGGLVKSVDAAAGVISITSTGFSGTQNVAVQVSKDTVIRRYAPGSVRFDDAKPGKLEQIKTGDQLRARGTRSPDGAQLTAEEIVSGSFLNLAGTIASIDKEGKTLTVVDLATKKPVSVAISGDSQLKKLPPMLAERIALRLKGTPAGAHPASAEARTGSAMPEHLHSPTEGPRQGGDFQQMLNRMPPLTLDDLQKGEAVMIVATEPTPTSGPRAITLLAGVEPILTAAPSGSAASVLSPWSLGAGEPASQ